MARRGYGYSYSRRRKGGGGWFLFLLFLFAIAGGAGYIWFAPEFERVPPKIELSKEAYWSPKKPFKITIKDNQALGSYKIFIGDGAKEIQLASGKITNGAKDEVISVKIPEKIDLNQEKTPWLLRVEVKDKSLWNFGRGNSAVATSKIIVDRTPPVVGILAHSPSIIQGGSALVIFQARDKHLKDVYVKAGRKRWEVIPYKEKGYYATLFAWPFREHLFQAQIIAEDLAGNESRLQIPIDRYHKNYKKSWIKLSDRFLNGKIKDIASEDEEASKIADPLKRFKAVNENIREANERLIHKYTKGVTKVDFKHWRLRGFYPLKGAKRVASFGDERHYYYGNSKREVSRSYHLGYDLASVKNAPIISSNSGSVVFAGYNGIYGNMPIIDHGFGLYSLYGHCSSLLVLKGDRVRAGAVIAKTGQTGLALGDHLHFAILVQGVEVLPMDWMKPNWIKSHINGVFNKANRIIASRNRGSKDKN